MIIKIIFIPGPLPEDIRQLVGEIHVAFKPPPIIVNPSPATAIGETTVRSVEIKESFKISDSVSIDLECGICGSKKYSGVKHYCTLDVRHLLPEKNARLVTFLSNTASAVTAGTILIIGTEIAKKISAEELFKWVKDAIELMNQ